MQIISKLYMKYNMNRFMQKGLSPQFGENVIIADFI